MTPSLSHRSDQLLTKDHDHHTLRDPHRRASALSDIILGGQDGLVNVLGVILGVAAATADARIVMAAGLAATFAESVSMGAVAYTSTLADADVYESERAREYRHLTEVPRIERDEIRRIYEAKGFSGEILQRIVDTITRDPDTWVAVMMAEEHQLGPPHPPPPALHVLGGPGQHVGGRRPGRGCAVCGWGDQGPPDRGPSGQERPGDG